MSERTIGGRYNLLEPLAREGDWLAEDTELGRQVTLRLLDPDGEPFETSARAAASLSHPHIGRLYEYGESDGTPFVVAEHLPGGPLASRLETGGPLSSDEADRVGRDVAGALAYAHAQGVAHGDLGAASVQFDAEGRAKVTDFGTVSGGSYAADVAAFGALGFRMLTGADPGDPASLERLRPDASPALVATLLAALGAGVSAPPADGPGLVELLGAAPPAPVPPPAEHRTEILAPVAAAPVQRRRGPAAVGVVLALLGAGIAAAMFAGGDGAGDGGAPQPSFSLPGVSTATTSTDTEPDHAPTTSAPETTTEATTSSAATTTQAATTQAPPPATTQAPPPTTEAPPPPPPTEDPTTAPTEETTTADTTTAATTAP